MTIKTSGSSSGLSSDRLDRIGLTLLTLTVALPMAWSAGYALLYSVGGIGHLSTGWSWRYWQGALSTGGLRSSLWYSPTLAAASTLAALVVSLIFVVFFPTARHSRSFQAILTIPLATPAAVTAFLVYQWLNPGGFASRLLHRLNLVESPADFPILVMDEWSIGILVAQLWSTTPLFLLYCFKTWEHARVDRFRAVAEALGASPWSSRLSIALPMLARRVRGLAILTFLANLGAYEIPLLLGRQAPQMFSVLAQRRFTQFDLEQRPQAFALASVYLTLVSVGLAFALLRSRRDGQSS
ncbi:MAG: ABC transporter permease subunit [Pirellulales bacterium]